MIGLLLRREKLKAIYPTMKALPSLAWNMTSVPITASADRTCHPDVLTSAFTLSTIAATYYCAVCMIIGNFMMMKTADSISPNALLMNGIITMNGICLMLHMTMQSFLIRSGHRKTNKLRQIFAFLILTNFSIWILEIHQVSVKFSHNNWTLDSLLLPPVLMSLNRFQSALLFIHFWKSK